jgi:hypothetical protein
MAAEPMVPTEASQTRKHPKRAEANEESPGPVESRTYGSLTVEIPMKKSVISSKRSAPDGRDPELEQPTKRAKVIKLQSAKSMPLSNSTLVSKHNTEDTTVKKPSSAMKKDTNRKKARPPESDDEDHLPKKPAPKRARFVEESKPLYVLCQLSYDNIFLTKILIWDFSVQISSEKQKENVVSRKAKTEKVRSICLASLILPHNKTTIHSRHPNRNPEVRPRMSWTASRRALQLSMIAMRTRLTACHDDGALLAENLHYICTH